MRELSHKKLLKDQLFQVFEYAEIITRLNQAQSLLNIKGGYMNERNIHEEIEKLKEHVFDQFSVHLNNSKLSEQAMCLLDEFKSIKIKERIGAKYKIGTEFQFHFGVYEIISIHENKYASKDNEKIVYLTVYGGHDGSFYELKFEYEFNEMELC